MINNVVIVSGAQQSGSVIHILVSILFQILFPFKLLHNIEQSSLCYTVGPCCLSILNIAVCTCQLRLTCTQSTYSQHVLSPSTCQWAGRWEQSSQHSRQDCCSQRIEF